MSQTEQLHWCSAYHAAPPADEESEIVAQFLAAPYPYQNDDDDDQLDQKRLGDVGASSAYSWPDHVTTDPTSAGGACYWPPSADDSSNAGSGGGYVDDGGCYYYCLGEADVSLGINTRATLPFMSIDLNLLGDGEEDRNACVQPVVPPNPSPADHVRTRQLDGGNDGAPVSRPKRKVPAGRDGGDLGGNKKKKAYTSKTARKCVQEKTQSSSSCSGNESICSEAHVGGGNVKARASKGSATDPQSLYARKRRERINERLKILQKLVPNGTKVDISTMLEEAVQYVRFLQLQIKMLSSDETWMYAPIAYNGMSLGIDL